MKPPESTQNHGIYLKSTQNLTSLNAESTLGVPLGCPPCVCVRETGAGNVWGEICVFSVPESCQSAELASWRVAAFPGLVRGLGCIRGYPGGYPGGAPGHIPPGVLVKTTTGTKTPCPAYQRPKSI